jgi:hypothetical protein
MVTVASLEVMIRECSMYEEHLGAQLAYAERDAPETIISLVDLIDRVRRLKAELTAAHPNQISRRNRRADLLAHIIEGKAE